MPVINRNISLKTSAEWAFQYLRDPAHLTEYCQNVVEVGDVQRHPSENIKFTWTYKMMGVHIFGEAEVDEPQHNQQLAVRFWGGIHGSIVWKLRPENDGIHLDVQISYMIPAPLLMKHSEDEILHQNELAVEHMLANLKTVLDGQPMQTLNRL